MSMGNSACFAEVIEPKNIRRILGKEDGRKLTSFIRLFNKLEEDEGASSLIEFLTVAVNKRACRAGALEDADAGTVICEVQIESISAFVILPLCIRSPGIVCP